MSQLTDKVESAISNNITLLGLELEYTELVKEGDSSIYRVVIDKPGSSVSIDDCENLSRSIEDIVDKFVNVNGGYVLEVSSAGIERQLKNVRLYKKYIGEKVNIKLFKKINGEKEHNGKLTNVINNEFIIIEENNEELKIELKDIAHANTIFDF